MSSFVVYEDMENAGAARPQKNRRLSISRALSQTGSNTLNRAPVPSNDTVKAPAKKALSDSRHIVTAPAPTPVSAPTLATTTRRRLGRMSSIDPSQLPQDVVAMMKDLSASEQDMSTGGGKPFYAADLVARWRATLPYNDGGSNAGEHLTYIDKIASYCGEDPLSVWTPYINWCRELYENDDDRDPFFKVLAECIDPLSGISRYVNDRGFVDLCIDLVDNSPAPLPTLRQMISAGIGTKFAVMYEAMAILLEDENKFDEAEDALLSGMQAGVEPAEINSIFLAHKQRVKQRKRELAASECHTTDVTNTTTSTKQATVPSSSSHAKSTSNSIGLARTASATGTPSNTTTENTAIINAGVTAQTTATVATGTSSRRGERTAALPQADSTTTTSSSSRTATSSSSTSRGSTKESSRASVAHAGEQKQAPQPSSQSTVASTTTTPSIALVGYDRQLLNIGTPQEISFEEARATYYRRTTAIRGDRGDSNKGPVFVMNMLCLPQMPSKSLSIHERAPTTSRQSSRSSARGLSASTRSSTATEAVGNRVLSRSDTLPLENQYVSNNNNTGLTSSQLSQSSSTTSSLAVLAPSFVSQSHTTSSQSSLAVCAPTQSQPHSLTQGNSSGLGLLDPVVPQDSKDIPKTNRRKSLSSQLTSYTSSSANLNTTTSFTSVFKGQPCATHPTSADQGGDYDDDGSTNHFGGKNGEGQGDGDSDGYGYGFGGDAENTAALGLTTMFSSSSLRTQNKVMTNLTALRNTGLSSAPTSSTTTIAVSSAMSTSIVARSGFDTSKPSVSQGGFAIHSEDDQPQPTKPTNTKSTRRGLSAMPSSKGTSQSHVQTQHGQADPTQSFVTTSLTAELPMGSHYNARNTGDGAGGDVTRQLEYTQDLTSVFAGGSNQPFFGAVAKGPTAGFGPSRGFTVSEDSSLSSSSSSSSTQTRRKGLVPRQSPSPRAVAPSTEREWTETTTTNEAGGMMGDEHQNADEWGDVAPTGDITRMNMASAMLQARLKASTQLAVFSDFDDNKTGTIPASTSTQTKPGFGPTPGFGVTPGFSNATPGFGLIPGFAIATDSAPNAPVSTGSKKGFEVLNDENAPPPQIKLPAKRAFGTVLYTANDTASAASAGASGNPSEPGTMANEQGKGAASSIQDEENPTTQDIKRRRLNVLGASAPSTPSPSTAQLTTAHTTTNPNAVLPPRSVRKRPSLRASNSFTLGSSSVSTSSPDANSSTTALTQSLTSGSLMFNPRASPSPAKTPSPSQSQQQQQQQPLVTTSSTPSRLMSSVMDPYSTDIVTAQIRTAIAYLRNATMTPSPSAFVTSSLTQSVNAHQSVKDLHTQALNAALSPSASSSSFPVLTCSTTPPARSQFHPGETLEIMDLWLEVSEEEPVRHSRQPLPHATLLPCYSTCSGPSPQFNTMNNSATPLLIKSLLNNPNVAKSLILNNYGNAVTLRAVSGSMVALWELYVCHILSQRLRTPILPLEADPSLHAKIDKERSLEISQRMLLAATPVTDEQTPMGPGFAFVDATVVALYERCTHGTLAHVLSAEASSSTASTKLPSMDGPLGMYYAIEMLRCLEALHSCQVAHMHVRPDTFYFSDESSKLGEWTSRRENGWNAHGLLLSNMSSALDIPLFCDATQRDVDHPPFEGFGPHTFSAVKVGGTGGPSCSGIPVESDLGQWVVMIRSADSSQLASTDSVGEANALKARTLASCVYQTDVFGVVNIAFTMLMQGIYCPLSMQTSPRLGLSIRRSINPRTGESSVCFALADELPPNIPGRKAWLEFFDILLNLPTLASFVRPSSTSPKATHANPLEQYTSAHLSALASARRVLEVALEAEEAASRGRRDGKTLVVQYLTHRSVVAKMLNKGNGDKAD